MYYKQRDFLYALIQSKQLQECRFLDVHFHYRIDDGDGLAENTKDYDDDAQQHYDPQK
ncbi:hypothetical protein OZ666_11090 [Elizabethkingia sp. HX QKY]|uniref:hypothetical protein n=1 Tax=Elizabethkingia TaxID=308865 RepID=UPI002A23C947|nr:hypothetical protein [Elizabethkingia sp. HX QKY]MDX8572228.1 hypothetical protein [Elizabethkingia sp. HX QKY]